MPNTPSTHSNRNTLLGLLAVIVLCVLVYMPGLAGPFLFDDSVHISQNEKVHINDLSLSSLIQAWRSSYSSFPSNRPLAQLTFGINHAVGGLSTRGFKATNLGLHLVCGLLVFGLMRCLFSIVESTRTTSPVSGTSIALLVSAIWLLHPLNLTTVLYTVQRMAQLSTLFMLAGLWLYSSGRIRLSEGKPGVARLILAFVLAVAGFFGKENTVIFPLLLLGLELTLFRQLPPPSKPAALRTIQVAGIALPLIVGGVYLLTHPSWYDYSGRPFSMEERILTQFRALSYYLQLMVIPDLRELGFYHDDIAISRGLLSPPTTLVSILFWTMLSLAALVFAKRLPIFAFSVLFFLSAHSLESSFLPLEMFFEHRNYLALIGPITLIAWWLLALPTTAHGKRLFQLLAVLLCIVFATATFLRAGDWQDIGQLSLTEAEHHPNSTRANYRAAQTMIQLTGRTQGEDRALADTLAGEYLQQVLKQDENNLNGLFALLILDLHMDRTPSEAFLTRLQDTLRTGDIGPTSLSITQFSYLVRWHMADGHKLADSQIRAIFDAVLQNPALVWKGRASVASAYRAYYERILDNPEKALIYAREAVRNWPARWDYWRKLLQLLLKNGYYSEVSEAVAKAKTYDRNNEHGDEIKQIEGLLNNLPNQQTARDRQ